MKNFIVSLLLSFFCMNGLIAHPDHSYKEIHIEQLKEWYDRGQEMVVLDARSKEYFDGQLLPHAVSIPHHTPITQLKRVLPSRDSVIIVYCSNKECPASKMLAKKLVSEGYTNVYKYPAGMQEWLEKGYPTEKG